VIGNSILIRIVGAIVKILIYYISICILANLISLYSLKNSITLAIEPFISIQKYMYFNGIREIWQYKKECINFNKFLWYEPKIGSCNFNNSEFNTSLNFDKYGRVSSRPNFFEKESIVVIGDSHTMGWGVNDEETFSAILEKKIDRTVFNLGVSSYGTYRELLRLENSGVLNLVNTIIIQYCDNDLEENVARKYSDKEKPLYDINSYKALLEASNINEYQVIRKWVMYTIFELPFNIIQNILKKENNYRNKNDFESHIEPLIEILKKFPSIRKKNVIIFYINGEGVRFENYKEKKLENIKFINIETTKEDFFNIDDHLNTKGHMKIAEKINTFLKEEAELIGRLKDH